MKFDKQDRKMKCEVRKLAGMDSINRRDGIIHATFQGNVNVLALLMFLRETLALSDGQDVKALLLDLKSANLSLRVVEVFRLPATLLALGLKRWQTVAWLMKDISKETMFYETVFVNQGFKSRLFTDLNDAETWLTATTSQMPVN